MFSTLLTQIKQQVRIELAFGQTYTNICKYLLINAHISMEQIFIVRVEIDYSNLYNEITPSFFSSILKSLSRTTNQSLLQSKLTSNGINSYFSIKPSKNPPTSIPYAITPNLFYFRQDLHLTSLTQQHTLRFHLFLQLTQPIIDAFETLWVSKIKNKQSDLCISIIEWHDGSETLVSCCIPYIELYLLPRFGFYFFLLIGSSKCRFMHLLENSLFVSHGDGCFSDCRITTKYQFDCLLDCIGFLQNFVFGWLDWFLFFSTVTHQKYKLGNVIQKQKYYQITHQKKVIRPTSAIQGIILMSDRLWLNRKKRATGVRTQDLLRVKQTCQPTTPQLYLEHSQLSTHLNQARILFSFHSENLFLKMIQFSLHRYQINNSRNFELKYYFFMFKNRSLGDCSLSDYYFTVAPLSLQFDRQHKTRFHFFFQKNQQIISKYQSPAVHVQKNETVKFAPPHQIQPFRIANQKSMEYEWSLYIFRVDIQGDNEELVQKQKISLKDEWNGFKQNRGAIYECNVKFKSIRCKLSYLVVIGSNNKELLDNQSKISVITTDEKITKLQSEQQKPGVSKSQETRFRQEYTKVSKQSKKQRVPIDQQIKISEVLHRGRYSFESEMSLLDYKNMGQQFLSMKEDEFIKLSNSQLEIGQQIESKIQQIDTQPNVQRILQPESPLLQKSIKHQQPSLKLTQSEEKNIRMTSSQILNSKKEDISPKNYIVLFITIIVLTVAGGFWLLGNSGPKIPQKAKNRRSKNPKKEAKQTPAKKTRSKQ